MHLDQPNKISTSVDFQNDLPFVSVAVITLNSGSTIQQCLHSLSTLDYPPDKYEIVIVDGGSTDGTMEVIGKFPVRVVVDKRRSRGLARNTAVMASRGEIIAFTDADCLASKDWLKDHVSIHHDPHILVVAGAVLQGGSFGLPTTLYHQTYFATQSPLTPRRKTWEIASANASFKASTFRIVGAFRQLDRGEESLLCWEVIQRGFDVIFDPSIRVIHLHKSMTYMSLLQRCWDEGYSDRCLQTAFGNFSPFRLPRRFAGTIAFSLSLCIARAARYFIKLWTAGYRRIEAVLSIPVLLAASFYWVHGYATAAKKGGLENDSR